MACRRSSVIVKGPGPAAVRDPLEAAGLQVNLIKDDPIPHNAAAGHERRRVAAYESAAPEVRQARLDGP